MRTIPVLPTMFTLGNAVCGFGAIVQIATIQFVDGAMVNPNQLVLAAYLILLAMIFDALDGKIARLANQMSDFGAQLDSLADMITFGIAPALLIAVTHSKFSVSPFWARISWILALAYMCGAILRLARFNAESEHEEDSHQSFKGLPSPAAAGCIAALVIVQGFLMGRAETMMAEFMPALHDTISHEAIISVANGLSFILPMVAFILGGLMISKFEYVHFANRFLSGRKPKSYILGLVGLILLTVFLPEVTIAFCFLAYALSGPVRLFLKNRHRSEAKEQPAT